MVKPRLQGMPQIDVSPTSVFIRLSQTPDAYTLHPTVHMGAGCVPRRSYAPPAHYGRLCKPPAYFSTQAVIGSPVFHLFLSHPFDIRSPLFSQISFTNSQKALFWKSVYSFSKDEPTLPPILGPCFYHGNCLLIVSDYEGLAESNATPADGPGNLLARTPPTPRPLNAEQASQKFVCRFGFHRKRVAHKNPI